MEFEMKSISPGGIEAALAKAETYRFLHQPEDAESICRDVLAIQPDHQLALRVLGLSITDQFAGDPSDRYGDAEKVFLQLTDEYERIYYSGLLYERRAKAQLSAGRPPHTVTVLLESAMEHYEQAGHLRPAGNDDAILRWNRCARLLQSRLESEWHREVGIEMGE